MAPIGITGIAYMGSISAHGRRSCPSPGRRTIFTSLPARSTVLNFVDAAERILARLATLDIESMLKHLDTLLVTVSKGRYRRRRTSAKKT